MNDKKQIFGWAMYDWANSAYITTVAVAVLPIYFSDVVVPQGGVTIGGNLFRADDLWAYTNGLATLLIFLLAPVLGTISDFSASKKKFLMAFCYGGSLFAALLFFSKTGDVWTTMAFYFLSQVGFVGANVFYDAFLPQIASSDRLDWVSGKGFAFGYLGGGLQFAISLGLIALHERIGISASLAAQIAMLMAAVWWAGFSIITFINLKEAGAAETLPEAYQNQPKWTSYLHLGIIRTFNTIRKVVKFKHFMLFLIAYLIYNDGIQTVIKMATIYGRVELELNATALMVTLLIIQFVGIGGAFLFGWLGTRIGTKRALIIAIAIWCFVLVYAFLMKTTIEFFILGVIVGIVLGGSQALSRSFYGSMIPVNASGEFYGFYSVFSKFSGIFGMFTFGIVRQLTGTARLAILSLLAFFIIGLILLILVNVEKARLMKLDSDAAC